MTQWWMRHWFRDTPPHIFAALRIALGAVGMVTMLGLWDVPLLLSLDGIAPEPPGPVNEAILQAGLGLATGWALWILNFGAFTALLIGWYTTAASLILFVVNLALVALNPMPLSGAQLLLHTLTIYPLLADCGRVWSVDAWRAARRGTRLTLEPQPIWPLRLLQYQVCVIYLTAAMWKILDPTWRAGEALHYILNQNVFQRIPGEIPTAFAPVLTFLTYATILWEGLFTPAMLRPVTRRVFLLIGVAMHMGMWVLLDFGPFTLTMLTAYIAFIDPERVRRFDERLRSSRKRVPTTGTPDALRAS